MKIEKLYTSKKNAKRKTFFSNFIPYLWISKLSLPLLSFHISIKYLWNIIYRNINWPNDYLKDYRKKEIIFRLFAEWKGNMTFFYNSTWKANSLHIQVVRALLSKNHTKVKVRFRNRIINSWALLPLESPSCRLEHSFYFTQWHLFKENASAYNL